jgi:predicted kinase
MGKMMYVMQGLPGSGKSTMAELIRLARISDMRDRSQYGWTEHDVDTDHVAVHSTDEFWIDDCGNYDFDRDQLGAAHRWNQMNVLHDLQNERHTIIVDNTNIKRRDARPYIVMAKMFDWQIQIVRVVASVEECIWRQELRSEDRRVPEEVIRRMAEQMEDLSEEL